MHERVVSILYRNYIGKPCIGTALNMTTLCMVLHQLIISHRKLSIGFRPIPADTDRCRRATKNIFGNNNYC
jgi:hypothetical protein